MKRRLCGIFAIIVFAAGAAMAQDSQEARALLKTVSTAMGADNMKSVQYTGKGYYSMVGQNFQPENDWPKADLVSYTRTIDFETKSSKEEMVLKQNAGARRGGGLLPVQGELHLTFMVNGNYAWKVQNNKVIPIPEEAEKRRLMMWLTPHGFIKAAQAADKLTLITRYESGNPLKIISFTALGKYRVNGTINGQNLVSRIQTWFPDPVRGDLYYEIVLTQYKEFNGIKIPGVMHEHHDHDADQMGVTPNVSGGHNSFEARPTDIRMNVTGVSFDVPDSVRTATIPPVRVEVQKLADGVWLMGGATHNSIAVEFKDFIAVVEAPLNEKRSLAVIDEIKKLAPNKQIRFIVNTHHHWDHIGGLRAYVHEGATVITHRGNRAFYEEVMYDRPWTLEPDRLSLYPPEEVAEGYTYETLEEEYTVSDLVRNLKIYHVQNLDHAEGMLIAYLPKEKILVEADLFTPPPPDAPAPAKPSQANTALYQNVKRLKLDVATVAPIHGRSFPWSDFEKFMGKSASAAAEDEH